MTFRQVELLQWEREVLLQVHFKCAYIKHRRYVIRNIIIYLIDREEKKRRIQ